MIHSSARRRKSFAFGNRIRELEHSRDLSFGFRLLLCRRALRIVRDDSHVRHIPRDHVDEKGDEEAEPLRLEIGVIGEVVQQVGAHSGCDERRKRAEGDPTADASARRLPLANGTECAGDQSTRDCGHVSDGRVRPDREEDACNGA